MSSEQALFPASDRAGDDIAVRVENLSKYYRIYPGNKARLRQIFFPKRKYYEEFWALKDINFEVKRGEALGIVGLNGAGKSTLLQVLAGISMPTTGGVTANGRISALLELGSGFNPQFTGRENAYMNGAIMGLSRKQMEAKIDEIEEFADIGEFFDRPVWMYSSGMSVRLGFAVAISVDPDILVVDEALAVGDERFQFKCIMLMNRRLEEGVTLLFVSHSLPLVQQLCSKTLWLEHGTVRDFGKTIEVTERYEEFCLANLPQSESGEIIPPELESGQSHLPEPEISQTDSPEPEAIETSLAEPESGQTEVPEPETLEIDPPEPEVDEEAPVISSPQNNGGMNASELKLKLAGLSLLSADGRVCSVFQKNDKMIIRMEYIAEEDVPNAVFGISIHTTMGFYISGSNNLHENSTPIRLKKGKGFVEACVERIPLNAGVYFLSYGLNENLDMARRGIPDHLGKYHERFEIRSDIPYAGIVDISMKWSHLQG